MRALLVSLLILCIVAPAGAGFVLTEENDAFSGSDDQYTQGLEMKWVLPPKDGVRYGFGARSLIYTPQDIDIAEPQPDDRPWAGLSGVFLERWCRRESFLYRTEAWVGAMGEDSYSGEIQVWFHDLIDSQEPMGWDNQGPNELFVNFSGEIYIPALEWEIGSLGADITLVGGGRLGTAFIGLESGLLLRAGWNVPEDYKTGLVKPTVDKSGISLYGFAEMTGRYVGYNATLDGSMFHGGPSVKKVPLVAESRSGIALGYLGRGGYDVGLSYSIVFRSPEYRGQEDIVDFGSIAISFGKEL